MGQRDFVPGGHVRTHLKDLDAARASAREHALNLPLMELMHGALKALSARGMSDYDNSAILLELEGRNPPLKLIKGPDQVP